MELTDPADRPAAVTCFMQQLSCTHLYIHSFSINLIDYSIYGKLSQLMSFLDVE